MENLFILILIAVVVLFIINLNSVEPFEVNPSFKQNNNNNLKSSTDNLGYIIDNALAIKDTSNNPINSTKSTITSLNTPTKSIPDNSGIMPNSLMNYDVLSNYEDNYTLGANTNDPKYVSQTIKPRENLQTKDLLPGKSNEKWFDSYTDLFDLDKAISIEVPEMKFGIDTVGQSKKNASRDIRVAPPCPKFVVSPWNNSTIEPDYNIKSLC
jgi:hypothetical protein